MPRISLAGFKDPVRRPRFVIWTGTIVLVLIPAFIVVLGVTSTRWFCAEVCHRVQDDTIIAYSHSPHDTISCMACHLPVNADPVTFLIHKAGALGELYATLTNTYELPLNPGDEVALSKTTMPEQQCTQCHDLARSQNVPNPDIFIDHRVHSRAGYQCTVCHNRVAHVEDFKLTLPGNRKHADFMTMDACFRCHGLMPGAKAPGECTACHPKDFPRKPAYHLRAGFFPKGHGQLAKKASEQVAEAEKAERESAEKPAIPPLGTVNTCYTCHVKATFCDKCHGRPDSLPTSHKDPTWLRGKSLVVSKGGKPGTAVTSAVHARTFLDNAGAQQACALCHGAGGANAKFCRNCHKLDVPHPKDANGVAYASQPGVHPTAGKRAPATCSNCHRFKELCSDCHHTGATNATPWLVQHPASVRAAGGAGACFEKCHKKGFCNACHTARKVPLISGAPLERDPARHRPRAGRAPGRRLGGVIAASGARRGCSLAARPS